MTAIAARRMLRRWLWADFLSVNTVSAYVKTTSFIQMLTAIGLNDTN